MRRSLFLVAAAVIVAVAIATGQGEQLMKTNALDSREGNFSRATWRASMTREAFTKIKFRPATLLMIKQANAILEEYAAQGFTLTVRQLFYQFVARDYRA